MFNASINLVEIIKRQFGGPFRYPKFILKMSSLTQHSDDDKNEMY